MKAENQSDLPFTEAYWKQEGGVKWVENIESTESSLEVFNEILLEQALVMAGEKVLDVGCGGGVNSIEIARRVGPEGRVMGVDISSSILSIARARGDSLANLEFVEGDAALMDFRENDYDLVFSRFGVMFFSDPITAFKNLRHSLKSNGRMVFLCWRSLHDNPWMNIPAQAVADVMQHQAPAPDPLAPGPFSFADSTRIQEVLTEAGLKMLDLKAVDVVMKLGPLSETVEYFMNMGPAAAALVDTPLEVKAAAAEAVSRALGQFVSNDKVNPPAAAWLVMAGK